MGFLRGALVTVIGVVLLISLVVMNTSLTLTWSLEYDHLKPVLKDAVMDYAEEDFQLDVYLDDTISVMQLYCTNETEYVFSQGGFTFIVPCEVISQGSSAVLNYGVGSLIENLYYSEYDCEFWDCVKKADNFLVLISEKSHDYWQGKFRIFMLISMALFVLMFLVSNRKSNAFILAGIVTIVSALPFLRLNWISIFLPTSFRAVFLEFFSRSHNVAIIGLIIGGFLLALGIAFHFLRLGLKISKLFNKHAEEQERKQEQEDDLDKEDVKKIVKKELAASKQSLGSSASEKGSERKEKVKEAVKKEIIASKAKPEKVVSKGPEVKKNLIVENKKLKNK